MDQAVRIKVSRGHVAIAALVVVAFCWGVFGSAYLFPYLSDDRDEAVYLFQALNLLKGRVTVPMEPLSSFFSVVFQGPANGHLVFKYTPVHALFLAVGKGFFGSFRVSLGLIAGADIWLLYLLGLELHLPRRAALLASGFLLLSPLFLVLGATYLSYLSFLLLALAALVCLLRARRLPSRNYYLAGGALLALSFFARPFDGLLVSCCVFASFRREWRELGWTVIGGAPFVLLTALHNWHVMGRPWRFSFSQDPLDTLGFGMRRMVSTTPPVHFGPTESNQATLIAAALLVTMVFGSATTLGFVIAALRRKRKLAPRFTAVTFLFVAYPVAYFFFWGHYMFLMWGAIYYLGPVYFVPLLPPLTLLCALELDRLLSAKAKLGAAVLAAMAISSGLVLWWMVAENQKHTNVARQLIAPIEAAHLKNGVMFLPAANGASLGNVFPSLMNSPDPGGPVVYAVDQGSSNFTLLEAYPGRDPFRVELPSEAEFDHGPQSQVTHLRHFRGVALVRTFEISNPSELPRLEFVIRYEDATMTCTLDATSKKDKTYEVRLEITQDGVRLPGGCVGGEPSDFPGPGDSGFKGILVHFGDATGERHLDYKFRYDVRRHAGGIEALLPARTAHVFVPRPSEGELPSYLAAVREADDRIKSP